MYYSEMTFVQALMLEHRLLIEPEPKCEYRSPQLDGGTGIGRIIPCRNKAAMWTDRGPRCEDHRRD